MFNFQEKLLGMYYVTGTLLAAWETLTIEVDETSSSYEAENNNVVLTQLAGREGKLMKRRPLFTSNKL